MLIKGGRRSHYSFRLSLPKASIFALPPTALNPSAAVFGQGRVDQIDSGLGLDKDVRSLGNSFERWAYH